MEHLNPNANRASDNHSMCACLDHVMHLIAQATRPVVVAGSKLRLKHVLDEFMHFANALGKFLCVCVECVRECIIKIFVCKQRLIDKLKLNTW